MTSSPASTQKQMFAGEVISQAVTRHFRGPVESGICFGIPRRHLKRNGRVVSIVCRYFQSYKTFGENQ